MPQTPAHVPVMLSEVLEALRPRPGGRYLDATLGLGGHAAHILRSAGPGAQLLGLDRDLEALALAGDKLKEFASAVQIRHCAFADFATALDGLGWEKVDGVILDAGVSSLQLDSPERGFSFLRDGPLDMRLDQQKGRSAADLINSLGETDLSAILEKYGEEPIARRIARAVTRARAARPLTRTLELSRLVEEAYPPRRRATARNHPATKTFQALRLAVNDEIGQLGLFLERIIPRLNPGGRLAVISFHSLEDRLVKHFFRNQAAPVPHGQAALRLVTQKALSPSPEECSANPRARSGKLRVAERLGEQAS
ncbi:MAG: 16S rRNA (cytosine(1402)-N(4))-methyltransferase RsmH [Desulfovibrionaceae bacterium]|nr:16S rRNA (cytosine(1402)-N(4))-methyltransferase RsmH [Desulfovibrionaceae bacterium]